MNEVYLLLGGNIGNRLHNLATARAVLQKQVGVIAKASKIYETASWGDTGQPSFLNQVLLVETNVRAEEIMRRILLIEHEMGRVRTIKNASRIIDIDILFYNKDIIEKENLVIPHPQIQNRNFVLYPLDEISPGFEHPILKTSIHQLLIQCSDILEVKVYEI